MDKMRDAIKFVENEDWTPTTFDPENGGWRLSFDNAWQRDIEVGRTLSIISLFDGVFEVTVGEPVVENDKGRGLMLKPTELPVVLDGKVFKG